MDVATHYRETAHMQKIFLDAQVCEQLERAPATPSGRSATTVYGGHEHTLRQTVLALTAGTSLAEHENPGEATLFGLRERVRLTSGDTSWEGRGADLIAIPPTRHSLRPIDDAAVLLTLATPG